MAESRDPEAARKVTIALRANSDRASTRDQLGFKSYVTAIADFLRSQDTRPPLVLSIEGEWGSGKTSFMLQLRNALEHGQAGDRPSGRERLRRFFSRDFVTAWFNPWRYDREEALWAAFALSFINQLTRNQVFYRRWWGHVRRFLTRFRWREGWLALLSKTLVWASLIWLMAFIAFEAIHAGPNWNDWAKKLYEWITQTKLGSQDPLVWGISAGGVTAYLALLAGLFHWLKPVIDDPLKSDLRKYISGPNYADRIPFIDSFQNDFRSVLDAYLARGQKVAIFIDDLDRCEVPRAADLMAALNLMITDDPRLIFILGMDSEKVAAGLAVKYEKLLPYLPSESSGEATAPQDKVQNGLEFGHEFIKKFVQLPFVLPRPSQDQLDAYLKNLSESEQQPVPWLENLQKLPRRLVEALQRLRVRPSSTSEQGASTQPETARQTDSLPGPAAEAQGPLQETLDLLDDPAKIQEIVEQARPRFENNPRWISLRAKLVGLAARRAIDANLFDSGADASPLTLKQLARFITLRSRWPELYQDIDQEPDLLWALQEQALLSPSQQEALEQVAKQPAASGALDIKQLGPGRDRLELWRSNPDVMDFMAGCWDKGEILKDLVLELKGENLRKLLDLMKSLEPQKSRSRHEIITQGSKDSDAFLAVVEKLIPAFKSNPRRLKLFTNLLRLRAYIAEETGLFDDDFSPGACPPPTLEQLGKFITISMCWPALYSDIENEPRLLTALQQTALGEKADPARHLDHWRGQVDLMDLLQVDCWDATAKKIKLEKGYDWILEDIDLKRLLTVSPRVRSIVRQGAPAAVPVSVVGYAPRQVIKPRVFVINFDPVMDAATGARLTQTMGWRDVNELIDGYIADIDKCSDGLVKYTVVERERVDYFPFKVDGFQYDPDSFMAVMNGQVEGHSPDFADYNRILKDYDILAGINQAKFDEVWLFGHPYAGLFESCMGGPGAFWCNAPPLENTDQSTRRFVIMGFSCQRGVGEMLEDLGHRAESIMQKVYEGTRGDANLWRRFSRYDKAAPGQAEVGTMHFAPNSLQDYDWGNPTPVTSACDDWLNFPNLTGATRVVTCADWGNGDIREHHQWWLKHLPHAAGVTNGILNNWWQYVADPNQVK